jgi:3-deoxy-manno-octulosonate cytidylyltransferase (CMP-KDO synthetase)
MSILGVIPSRFASSRFPGKSLVNIGHISMIQRVYMQAKKCEALTDIIVATDDTRIFDHVKSFGGNVLMTDPTHASGTDRCFEVMHLTEKPYDYVMNIQGDEPFIQPNQISFLVDLLNGETEIATLVKEIEDFETLFNENTPKVVLNKNNEAIYFSRQTIPFLRGIEKTNWLKNSTFYKHIGIYAYRADVLMRISKLPQSPLEITESLEQLRWLEYGYKIKVAITPYDSMGIDTPADLQKAKEYLINNVKQ